MTTLTKQGVRDLGGNNRLARRAHRHFYFGPLVVVGYRSVIGDYGEMEADPIYAQRCLHCGKPGQGI